MNNFSIARLSVATWLSLWVSLLSGSAWGEGGVKLAPLFSDNMVLQRGMVNVVRGQGTPGDYISVNYEGREYGPRKVAKSGEWEIELSLENQTAPVTGPLTINAGSKKARRPALVLTNVAIGQVWILGVVSDRGVPASLPQNDGEWDALRRQPDFLRFITFTNLNAAADAASPPTVSWHVGSPDDAAFQQLRVLAYYWAFHLHDLHQLTRQYIGIIQARTNELTPWIRPDSWRNSLPQPRAEQLHSLNGLRTAAFDSAKFHVSTSQQARRQALIDAKRAGQVISPPPILQYDPPSVYLMEAFKSKLPDWLPSIEGAIW
jgi:hypothetical protein